MYKFRKEVWAGNRSWGIISIYMGFKAMRQRGDSSTRPQVEKKEKLSKN